MEAAKTACATDVRVNPAKAKALDPRPLPHDDAAERAVLAAMLMSASSSAARGGVELVGEVLAALDEADFYQPAHRLLYGAIRRLYERDRAVD